MKGRLRRLRIYFQHSTRLVFQSFLQRVAGKSYGIKYHGDKSSGLPWVKKNVFRFIFAARLSLDSDNGLSLICCDEYTKT
jgi:hypothetical protein